MLSNKQKALIHTAKHKLGLTEQQYRDLLNRIAGVSSSKDLTNGKFDLLMNEFKTLGFNPKKTPWKGKRYQVSDDKKAMFGKIGAILNDLNLTWGYADGIARKMFHIDKVLWLDPDQTYKVLQALTYHQKRAKARKGVMNEQTKI